MKSHGEVIKEFRKFTRFFFQEHDISRLDLPLTKTQVTILMHLDEHPETSMSEASRAVGLEKSSFTRAIDGLVREDFLARKFSPQDKRIVRLAFLPKGKRAVARIREDWDRNLETLLARLPARERGSFRKALDEVSRCMAVLMEETPG